LKLSSLTLLIVLLGWGAGCEAALTSSHTPADYFPVSGTTVEFSRGWAGWNDPDIGCAPYATSERVAGTLRVRSFGKKGGEGTELVLENGKAWIVAYGATEQHRDLAGAELIATGRRCNKQGQAIIGQHFHIESLTLLEPPM